MSKDTIQYQNALTEQYDHCYIEESEFGKQYIDKESKRTLILYQKPLGQTLVGLDLDQVETGQAYLKRELRARLEEAISYSNSNTPVITIFTDTLARILAGLGSPLSKEAEAVMNLTADRRPGKNQARLRDHCLLTSGVATALARTMLLKGYKPSDIASGITRFNEREALAMVRLAALCHDLGMHLPASHIERGQAFIRGVFTDLLEADVINEITEAVKRHYASKRYRLSGLAPETLLQEIVCYADCVVAGEDRPGDPNFNFPGYDEVHEWGYRHFGKETPLALIAADVDRVQG